MAYSWEQVGHETVRSKATKTQMEDEVDRTKADASRIAKKAKTWAIGLFQGIDADDGDDAGEASEAYEGSNQGLVFGV